MSWTQDAKGRWSCRMGADGQFNLVATPKGDGRWAWAVYNGAAENPMATGNVSKLNAAKSTMEQFLKGAGHI